MVTPTPFDLSAYLREKFPSLSLGGGLLHRWPLGVRFELGLDRFRERASKLYEAAFHVQDACVLISQDWPENTLSPTVSSRYFPLFSLPGAFDRIRLPAVQRIEHNDIEDDDSVLQWLQLPARTFFYEAVFEGIANHDHARNPSVSSRVYFLNRTTDVILHMYDDRGLDIIAARNEPLLRIRQEFPGWILEAKPASAR